MATLLDEFLKSHQISLHAQGHHSQCISYGKPRSSGQIPDSRFGSRASSHPCSRDARLDRGANINGHRGPPPTLRSLSDQWLLPAGNLHRFNVVGDVQLGKIRNALARSKGDLRTFKILILISKNRRA